MEDGIVLPLAVVHPTKLLGLPSRHLVDILNAGIMTWPGWSAAALIETFEQQLSGKAAIISLPIIEVPRGIDQLRDAILDQLVAAVLSVFPAWLPDAKHVEGPGGAGLSAVIDIARKAAGSSELLSSFLERMAKAGLQSRRSIYHADLPREVVARECAKLLRHTYGVPHLILILSFNDAVQCTTTTALDRALHWLASEGGWKVWLAQPNIVQAISLDGLINEPKQAFPDVKPRREICASQPLHMTPLAGQPSANSEAEKRLEARLSQLAWANGRAWNVTWRASDLHNPIRVDLIWQTEHCIVEIDGFDHLDPVKYAGDRRRDRDLQFAGFAILRFTNAEVLDDVENVTRQIQRYLELKRTAVASGELPK